MLLIKMIISFVIHLFSSQKHLFKCTWLFKWHFPGHYGCQNMPTLSHGGFGIFGGKILSHFWHVVKKFVF
jgi:hypothetical protein